MNSSNSDTWPAPLWMSAPSTGPYETTTPPSGTARPRKNPSNRPRSGPVLGPDGRPITLRLLPRVEPSGVAQHLGTTRRASPPPDQARVMSSLALVAALAASLAIQCAIGA